jgi:hypothetical protein
MLCGSWLKHLEIRNLVSQGFSNFGGTVPMGSNEQQTRLCSTAYIPRTAWHASRVPTCPPSVHLQAVPSTIGSTAFMKWGPTMLVDRWWLKWSQNSMTSRPPNSNRTWNPKLANEITMEQFSYKHHQARPSRNKLVLNPSAIFISWYIRCQLSYRRRGPHLVSTWTSLNLGNDK